MPQPADSATPLSVVRDGVRIDGESSGAGPAVLLLHGLTATRRYVVHGSRALERAGRRVIAYDARGHGRSGTPADTAALSYDQLIGDAVALLDAAGVARAALVGHSMGAATAAGLALTHPERVVALVLVSPAHRGGASGERVRWEALAAGLEVGGVEGFLAAYGRPPGSERAAETMRTVLRQRIERHEDLDALAAAVRHITRTAAFDGMGALEGISAPTLVIGSRDELDPEHPQAVAEEYAARIPGARLAVEAEGESPLAWRGGSLSKLVIDFLDEVDPLPAAAPTGEPAKR